MNCELIKIEAMIPKETYDRLVKLTKRQNANLSNNISSLIERGIDSTYEKWPMLAEQPQVPEGKVLVPVELIEFIQAKDHHLPIEDRHVLSVMLSASKGE